MGKILAPCSTRLGVQHESHTSSCSLSQALSKQLAGNVLRACNGTWQRQSAQDRGAVRGAEKGRLLARKIGRGWLQVMQLKRFLAKLLYCYRWCKKQRVHEPERSYPNTLRGSPWLWKPEAWCLCNCLSKIAVYHQLIPIVRGCVVWDLCVGIILRKNETKKRLCRLKNKEERKSPDGSGLCHEASS